MINPYEWGEYYLLITFRTRSDTYSYLLKHTSQEQFFEFQMQRDNTRQILDLQVCSLTEESADIIEEQYRLMGWDNRILIEGEQQ